VYAYNALPSYHANQTCAQSVACIAVQWRCEDIRTRCVWKATRLYVQWWF